MTPTAYIICGPQSSGNRLLASILRRSGCTEEGSTLQPRNNYAIPQAGEHSYALIRHNGIGHAIKVLRERGYLPHCIVLIREPFANCCSMVNSGHRSSFNTAYINRTQMIADNIREATVSDTALDVITYEGLTEQFLQRWLPMIGLPYVPGPLELPGQIVPRHIWNQNGKHYLPAIPKTSPGG